jgi:hypothetical protein
MSLLDEMSFVTLRSTTASRKPEGDEGGRADEFRNGGLQDPLPSVRAYFAQQLDGSAAPSEGRRRLRTKYTGQKPVMPL